MSQQFFNRLVKFTIGNVLSGGVIDPVVIVESPIRITFVIQKKAYAIANEGKVTLNNLSTSTRQKIQQNRNQIAILETGYKDAGGLQLTFYGDVVDVSHNIEKPEIITTVNIMDGHNALKQKKTSVSYKKGTPISQIIKDCTAALGLPLNASYKYVQLPVQNTLGTLAHNGSAAALLDRLCADNNLTWSIQNGSVKIVNQGKHDNTAPLSSYLIGSPKRLFKNLISQSLDDFEGYEFNALLMPKCEPYNTVTIQSNEIPKPIKLTAMDVHHVGDNYGDDWKTTVKAANQ